MPPVRARVPSRAFTSFAYSMNRIKDHELLMNIHEATFHLHSGVHPSLPHPQRGSAFPPALTSGLAGIFFSPVTPLPIKQTATYLR